MTKIMIAAAILAVVTFLASAGLQDTHFIYLAEACKVVAGVSIAIAGYIFVTHHL